MLGGIEGHVWCLWQWIYFQINELQSLQYQKSKNSNVDHPSMLIGWLRLLRGLTTNEHTIVLCKMATTYSSTIEQEIWFVGGKDGKTLQHWCEIAKLWAGIQNALKWLEAGYKNPLGENKNWLQVDVGRFRGKETMDYFVRDIPKGPNFQKHWSYVNSKTAYSKQHKYINLIPQDVIDHHMLISRVNWDLFLLEKSYHKVKMAIGDWLLIMKEEVD